MTDADRETEGGRFDQEADDVALSFFSLADLALSPEEYAAHQAHWWGCFSLHLYCYRDSALGAWVRRLGEIFFTAGEVERCRLACLSAEELARVRREEQEQF